LGVQVKKTTYFLILVVPSTPPSGDCSVSRSLYKYYNESVNTKANKRLKNLIEKGKPNIPNNPGKISLGLRLVVK
jgi:hypothetical protein